MNDNKADDAAKYHDESQATTPLTNDAPTTETPLEQSVAPVAPVADAPVEQTQPMPTEAPIAQPAPEAAATPVNVTAKQADPITLVLQWLTYAFWGWFALAMLWLSYVTFTFFADSSNNSDWSTTVAYPIAAAAVLFLMASATDYFYARREPARKAGIATAIMVIHTVIFALCGVGLIVTGVFTVIQYSLNANADSSLLSALYMAIVGVVIYAVLVARTTLVAKIKKLPIITTVLLGVTVLIFVILCITGPMMQSMATKQDRQIESALSGIQDSINDYVDENKKLPASLNDLTLSDTGNTDTKDLIQKGAIEYTANSHATTQDSSDALSGRINTTHYYELCATYTHANIDKYASSYKNTMSNSDGVSGYSNYLNAASHKEGRECYKIQTTTTTYATMAQ